MKSNFPIRIFLITTLSLLMTPLCHSDVINLSDGNYIVNINARLHGCGSWSGTNQAYWHSPSANASQIILPGGTYHFRIINPTDAASAYPELNATQLESIFTAWTYNSPWVVNYMVFDAAAITNPALTQLFDGAQDPNTPGSSTISPTAAYNHSVSSGYYNRIRPAPPGREGGPESFLDSFTFADPRTLAFAIPDTGLGDNGGGVSILVTSPIPEPGSLWMLGLASTFFLGGRRRRL